MYFLASCFHRRPFGFTMTELLMTLTIIGIIAAFIIPKMLVNAQRQETAAKVREAVGTLETVWYDYKRKGPGSDSFLYTKLVGQLNVTDKNTASPTGSTLCNSYPGYVQFSNGALIAGLTSGASFYDFETESVPRLLNYIICIDINGNFGPNRPGEDTFFGNFNNTGNFDAAGPLYTPNPNNKNFNWGGPNGEVYDRAGGSPLEIIGFGPIQSEAHTATMLLQN